MKKLHSLVFVFVFAAVVALGAWAPQPAHAQSALAAADLTSSTLETTASDNDPIIGVWVGKYEGYGNDTVERTVQMEIDRHDGNTFSGRLTITSETACWYLLEGTLDEKTGACSFAGTEWLQNSAGYDFVQFDGKYKAGSTPTIKGNCDGGDRTFSLKRVKKALPTYGSKVDKLNRVWKGEYDGYSGYDVVRRDYVLNISSYNHKTKEIKGTAYIKPSKKAAAYDGMNGSYKFSGTFDDQTGLITLQGHTWIQYPVGEYYLDFEFVKLAGYIDNTGSRITGMSQDGIWKMHAEKKSGLFGNAKTSQGYRYPKAYKKTQAAYPALANLTSVATYGMPGVVKSSSMVGVATDMVPQGICVAKDYILITAYSASDSYCSAIYVLSKSTGKLLKTLETSDANHVGGIAFDGNCVYVARSTQYEVGVIDYSTIDSAVKQKGNVVPVHYAKTISIWQTASFVTCYDGRLWVGYCEASNTYENAGYMHGYKIEGTKAEDCSLNMDDDVYIRDLPNYANGATFAKVNGELRLVVNASPGRSHDSTRSVYDVNAKTGAHKLLFTQMQPPMMEESCVDGSKTYTIFESSATVYSTVTKKGLPCKYIVDRVCVGQTSQLFSPNANTYATVGSGNKAASYRIKNDSDIEYAAPSPFNTAKSLTIPESGKIGKKTRTVSGIAAEALSFASKATTLEVKTTALTSSRVRNSLKGSKVTTVKAPSSRLKTYTQAFEESNSGKKVKVTT